MRGWAERWTRNLRSRLALDRSGLAGNPAGQADPLLESPGEPHPFDQQYGTETSGLIAAAKLRSDHRHAPYTTAYYAMSPSRFGAAIELWRRLPPAFPEREYSFVDLGCGKGRAVLLASRERFREAAGVELHPGLLARAQRNAALWTAARQVRSPIRLVGGDAAEFDFGAGPYLIYLFHPFTAPVMKDLLTHLTAALRHRPPGWADVIYFNPETAALWARFPQFRQVWSAVLAMSPEDAAADPFANPDDLCNGYRWQPATR